jgi:hypothetical protein
MQATDDSPPAPSAEQIEAEIHRLMLVRAAMQPPVPKKLPTATAPGLDVLIENQPDLSIAARAGGGFRLWLRHSGIGWLGFELDATTAAGTARFISHHTSGVEPVDLISTSDGQRH